MKKLLPVLLAGLMLLCAACAGPEGEANPSAPPETQSAYQRLTLANQKLESTSVSIDMDITLDMTQGGQTLANETISSVITVAAQGEDTRFSLSMDMEMEGMPISFTAFYVDGVYYMDLFGTKMKTLMPMEQAMDQAAIGYMDLDQALIMDEKAEGNTLSFTLKGDAMNQLFADVLGQLTEGMDESVSLVYDDMTYVITLNDDGTPARLEVDASFTIDDGVEEPVTVGLKLVMTLSDIGSATVEIPEDLDQYMETDLTSFF